MITPSVIKADIGRNVGHSSVHPDILDSAREGMEKAVKSRLVIDYLNRPLCHRVMRKLKNRFAAARC